MALPRTSPQRHAATGAPNKKAPRRFFIPVQKSYIDLYFLMRTKFIRKSMLFPIYPLIF
jgi:hypothetical protein